jgi:LPXTG-site transpeptidase (sortase) family protein
MNPSRTRHSKKILLRRVLFSIALILLTAAVVFLLLVVFHVEFQGNSTPQTIQTTVIKKSEPAVESPSRLKIPVINVDTAVYYVGLTSDGTMDIAKDPDKVAWYKFGPSPGEIGSAVIAGHYGWIGDKGSIFNDIHTLIKGDKLSVTDEKGTVIVFVVREIRQYDPESDATTIFKSNDGKSHLNLITCNGVWVNNKQSYSNRLVVFTDRKV